VEESPVQKREAAGFSQTTSLHNVAQDYNHNTFYCDNLQAHKVHE